MSLSPEVLRRLRLLRKVLPSQQDIGGSLEVYERVLGALPEAAALVAIARAEADCEWFPAPAVLKRFALEAGGALPAPDRAGRAWAEVIAAIGSVGRYRTPVFSDPLTGFAVARLGDWAGLCARESEWLQDWGRKAFQAEFASLVEYGPGEHERPMLGGIHDRERIEAPPALRALPSATGEDADRVGPPPEAVEALRKLGIGAGS